MTDHEATRYDISCAARPLYRQGLSVGNPVAILPNRGAAATGEDIQAAMPRMPLLEGKAEAARIPVPPLLWKDLPARLRSTDPDLFEGLEN